MSDFAICFAFVLENEAGSPPNYLAVPDSTRADPEAAAICGINSAAFPKQFAAIASLTGEQRKTAVEAFYRTVFFSPELAQLPNEIAKRVMDAEVNEGPGIGVKLLQEAVNSQFVYQRKLAVDGVWGPLTLSAATRVNQGSLLFSFQALRIARYQRIAEANPAEAINLRGWIARAEK